LSNGSSGTGFGIGLEIGSNGYNSPVHEMGIAIEVYRTCRETVEAHGGGRLQQARLAVGELSAVEPDLLVYAWEAVVEDGPDAGAELIIEWRPASQRCASCGENKDRASGSWMRLCPDCGMPLEVSGGDELDVLDLSFEAVDPVAEESARSPG
jgi:hydrogenase nickel incorporation protein HypA/HybF